jgi:hypothetical protein
MRLSDRSFAAALSLVLAAPAPALAHHSFAMFDFSRTVVIVGEVKEFRWTNPHVVVVVVGAPKGGGETEAWGLELTSPGRLTRAGWSKRSLNPGDRVEVELNPLRDGSRGGAFRKAVLVGTGQVLTTNLREAEQPGLQ